MTRQETSSSSIKLFQMPLNIVRSEGSQSGVALLVSLFAIMILSFIAVEISYDTNIEYIVSSKEYRRQKAYYAAKAGVDLSLLRILLYRKVLTQFGDDLGDKKSIVDMIWQFPFTWPPVAPEGLSRVDQGIIQDSVGESLMQGAQYLATISSEGSKIDVNDLASPSEALSEATKTQLIKVFERRADADDNFAADLRQFDSTSLINNIKDWVDEDTVSENGGDEGGYYDIEDAELPPNRSFRTIEEVRMVEGMTDEIYDFLAPQITVYGVKGINPNYAESDVLKSLGEDITDEIISEIKAHISDPLRGPFNDIDNFFGFLDSLGVRTEDIKELGIPLYFDAEYNFRIRSTGISGDVTREIIAIVYDFDKAFARLQTLVKEEQAEQDQNQDDDDQDPNSASTTTTTVTTTTKPKPPKGRPNIIYWYEN